jgi:hypothetical protein
MGFVVNKVALGHVFLLVFLFLPYENHSTVALLTHIQCHLGDDTTGRWRPQFRDILTPLRLNKSNNKTIICSCGLACSKSAAMMLDIEYV